MKVSGEYSSRIALRDTELAYLLGRFFTTEDGLPTNFAIANFEEAQAFSQVIRGGVSKVLDYLEARVNK